MMEPVRSQFRDGNPQTALRAGIRVTAIGAAVNLLLVFLKFWGGIVGHSQALIADAIHSVSDLLTDAVVILGLKWGHLEADENHPYGHARIETFSSLIIGIALISVGFYIGYEAIQTIYTHELSQPNVAAMVVAALSILLKETLYWYTLIVGRRLRSASLIANAWHHRSDALSSVAVLIGVAVGWLNPAWRIADAYAALIVAGLVIKVGISLGWRAFQEVVDTAPDGAVIARMHKLAESVAGVRETHDIRARRSGPQILAELHIVVDPELSVREGHDIAKEVELLLLDQTDDLTSVIIHVDPEPKAKESE